MKKLNKNIYKELQSKPDKFWVRLMDGYTELYIGQDNGGGTYYTLKGNYEEDIRGLNSTTSIKRFFIQNKATKIG